MMDYTVFFQVIVLLVKVNIYKFIIIFKLVALSKEYTSDSKSICTNSCDDGTVTNFVHDLSNVCLPCHSDCVSKKCIYGANSLYCTECLSS